MSCRLLYSIFLQEKNILLFHWRFSKPQCFPRLNANEQHYQLSIRAENREQKNQKTIDNPPHRQHSHATLSSSSHACLQSHFTNTEFPIYLRYNFLMTFFFSMQNGQIPKGQRNTWMGQINYHYRIFIL
jgi:hypothetical protein